MCAASRRLLVPESVLVEQRRWRWPIEIDERVPRDLAFVHEVGYWSHFDTRSSSSNWPLPEAATVEELAQYAGTSGALREAPPDDRGGDARQGTRDTYGETAGEPGRVAEDGAPVHPGVLRG
jgi:hypothetical protein